MKASRFAVVLAIISVFISGMSLGFDSDDRSALQMIFLSCRHRGGPMPSDDLRHYAEDNGLSDKEMSAMLLEFVRSGMEDNADKRQQRMGRCALDALSMFGGVEEKCVVLDIMRIASDIDFRVLAIKTCIRMMPDQWEEVVREVATGERYGNYDRFIAYEEAFRVGEHSDTKTKERIEQVMEELAEREASQANQLHLRRWANDLKAR